MFHRLKFGSKRWEIRYFFVHPTLMRMCSKCKWLLKIRERYFSSASNTIYLYTISPHTQPVILKETNTQTEKEKEKQRKSGQEDWKQRLKSKEIASKYQFYDKRNFLSGDFRFKEARQGSYLALVKNKMIQFSQNLSI